MSRGGNRLKYQTEQALKKINHIGQSKRAFRENGVETGIHSVSQMEKALSVSQNFTKWARETKGLKDLYHLKRSYYREYIDHMRQKEVSNGHLINIETNLRLLNKGMEQVAQDKGNQVRDWVPKTRLVDVKEREKPVDRSHTHEELEQIRGAASNNVKQAMDLQNAFGLRLREVAETRAAHIVEIDGKLHWQATGDKTALNTASGVTKGGRPRITPILDRYEPFVRRMMQNKEPNEKLVSASYNGLKSAYTRLDVGGSHSFRHSYAREQLLNEFKIRGIESTGRTMLQNMLENRKQGFRKDHEVTKEEKGLYREVNACVDRVHGYLGHGRGRIDLCEVYMKGI